MPEQFFWQVFRVFFKGATIARSTEFFNTLQEAEGRYYNIVAGDFNNKEITYMEAFVLDSLGNPVTGLKKVLDRRDFNPPEPEPEPEPQPEPEPEPEPDPGPEPEPEEETEG